MIKKTLLIALTAAAIGGCASTTPAPGPGGWITLIDWDQGLEYFNRVGTANWRAEGGAIVADGLAGKGAGYLVSKNAYRDFMLRAEFWVSDDANSGIFLRCSNPAEITDKNCYEANIFDKRPDPSYGTGAIVGLAKVPVTPKGQVKWPAGGKWNLYEITVQGSRLTLALNGQKTVEVEDTRLASGPFALQYGGGVVKWRKVQIKPLR